MKCKCGCGQELVNPSRRTLRRIRQGKSAGYVLGHQNWKGGRVHDNQGYIRIHLPDHPNATCMGYILEHRLVMATFLGRALRGDEVVHHLNENREDNRIENLLLTSKGAHSTLHQAGVLRTKRLDIECACCGKVFQARPATPATTARKYCSRHCSDGHMRGAAKLSRSDVERIRSTSGVSQERLAAMFSVGRSTIGRIVRGESWVER